MSEPAAKWIGESEVANQIAGVNAHGFRKRHEATAATCLASLGARATFLRTQQCGDKQTCGDAPAVVGPRGRALPRPGGGAASRLLGDA